ncbi:MAG TPA: hypothetical protein PK694_05815 [Rhodospirillales bacterium]|mgnify:CR=1 FL=1|nr:hypothetical protein [Rhodospirillales bacterium]
MNALPSPVRAALSAVVVAAVLVLLPYRAEAFSPGKCLRPPPLVDPIIYWNKCPEDPGGPFNVDAGGRDVLVRLPRNRVCRKRLSVIYARNLRINGGKFVYDDVERQVISIGHTGGATFIDGVHIDVNAKYADAIRFYRHTGTVVVQNTLVEGVSGIESGVHGDILHAQGDGPLANLTLQNVTGYTGYQGLFVPYRTATRHGTRRLKLDRVNLGYDPEVIVIHPLMLLFMGNVDDPLDLPPDLGTELINVFLDGSVRNFPFERAAYAYPVKDDNGCAWFDAKHGIKGPVCSGKPPSGDYAPSSRVGLNYSRAAFCSSTATVAAGTK